MIDCLNTNYKLKNEKDYSNHNNEFLHILDFEIVSWKIVYEKMVGESLNDHMFLYLKNSNKLLMLFYLFE